MPGSNILLYTTEDGLTKIAATFENDTVQLSLAQMAELFQRDKSTISRYIKKIFEKRELDRISVVANFATTTSDGKTYQAAYYNLEEPAKNYLNAQELDALNKIVSAYPDIAEVRALNHEPMYMKDWLETIDGYLKMTRREILTTKGSISHKQAIEKAHAEYDKYKKKQDELLSNVEKDFIHSIEMPEQIEDCSDHGV